MESRYPKASNLKSLEDIFSPINEPSLARDGRNRYSLLTSPDSEIGGYPLQRSSLTSSSSLEGSGSGSRSTEISADKFEMCPYGHGMCRGPECQFPTLEEALRRPRMSLRYRRREVFKPSNRSEASSSSSSHATRQYPSREEQTDYIHNVLYGRGSGKRLPAFQEITLDSSD